jgi:hypothetical protein
MLQDHSCHKPFKELLLQIKLKLNWYSSGIGACHLQGRKKARIGGLFLFSSKS